MMKPPANRQTGFTLIELLVVISIIGLLTAIVVPSLSAARQRGRSIVCLSNLRTLGTGWILYAANNREVLLPGRLPRFQGGGLGNPANHYGLRTGTKYRPRWPALMQNAVGAPALERPLAHQNRQNYDNPVYVCPSVSAWTDERNSAYGYNYQFLGNHRSADQGSRNMPVNRSRIAEAAGTVVVGDSNGSAASFPARQRMSYENNGRGERQRGNYGWLLDPPRLTPSSSRAGGRGSRRSGPDSRHHNTVNVVLADGHGAAMTLQELGYGVRPDGSIVDSGLGAHNRLFSGTGKNSAPP